MILGKFLFQSWSKMRNPFRRAASPLAKVWGFDFQMKHLWDRSQRCQNAWLSHQQKCHELFKTWFEKNWNHWSLQNQNEKPVLMILGAGLLQETPVTDKLLSRTKKIIFCDILPSVQVKEYLRRYPDKTEFVAMDITGILSQLDFIKNSYSLSDLEIVIQRSSVLSQLQYWPKADFIVSSNILSQLPLPIAERLKGTDEEKEQARQWIRQRHIEQMESLSNSAKVLIFFDDEVEYYGHPLSADSRAKFDLAIKSLHLIDSWSWEIAPRGEYDKDWCVRLKMKAYEG